MRYPAATWRPGPPEKTGYPGVLIRTGKGAVLHSMEGPLSAALGELDKEERRASWHFSNPKVGPLLGHFDIGAVTWHAGYEANCRFIGIEHEGVAGEPLTESQVANDVALLRWLAQQEGWVGFKRHVTLFEHNEFMATSCPSQRIPWDRIIAELEESIMPTADQYADEIIAILQKMKAEPLKFQRVLLTISAAQKAVVLVAQATAEFAKAT